MLNEVKIINYNVYNEGMRKSLLDKIFFIDKIDARVIVDYGCADGTLIEFMASLFPEYTYIGYDIDPGMLERAKEKCGLDKKFIFTSDWEVVKEAVRGQRSAVILNSVIHEIYAYGTRRDVDDMWQHIFSDGFDFIVIRDMISSITLDKRSDINDVKNILRKGDSRLVRDFENVWGSIEQNKNLIHFLLKYRYTDNWSREVRENYFPISREELLASVTDDYEVEFHEHFILPFFKNTVKKDFGIDVKDNTHIKLILRRTK